MGHWRVEWLAAASLALGVLACGVATAAEIRVYPAGALPKAASPERTDKLMGELRVRNVSDPSLTPFLPAPGKANGAAVVVAPGGGFVMLSWESEGTRVAQRLADLGYTAFVLKYRLDQTPDDPTAFVREFTAKMTDLAKRGAGGGAQSLTFPAEKPAAADAAEAIRLVRRRAGEWGIDPKRVGFVGFSAGGITAANVATLDPSGRPDFVGIIYGALRNPVPSDAPPAFIATSADDPLLKDAAIPMFQAWRAAGQPAELHLYEKGGHGYGMNVQHLTSDHWFDEFVWWMQARGVAGVRANGAAQ
jgi:acetyl esterase/lipase